MLSLVLKKLNRNLYGAIFKGNKMNMSKWEPFDEGSNAVTERLKVDGGYLYYLGNHAARSTNMCFVPDIDLTRYQAHLRDAYNQGFKDGQANLSESTHQGSETNV